jgi:hypothetical protein
MQTGRKPFCRDLFTVEGKKLQFWGPFGELRALIQSGKFFRKKRFFIFNVLIFFLMNRIFLKMNSSGDQYSSAFQKKEKKLMLEKIEQGGAIH